MEGIVSTRGQWTSRIGFILAAAGSAIGLGNIWGFPYKTGANGGGLFVLIYLFCVLFIGLPVMIAEIMIGRNTQKSPIAAFQHYTSKWSPWVGVGALGLIGSVLIMTFYSMIFGWTINYCLRCFFNFFGDKSPEEIKTFYTTLRSGVWEELLFHGISMGLTIGILYGGVKEGIEKWSKILMPMLFLIVLGLVLYSAIFLFDGFKETFKFTFWPNNSLKPSSLLVVVGQAFFSLSLGMGTMLTYGSYLSRKDDIPKASLWICSLDTSIAIAACFVVFPIIFQNHGQPTGGPGLIFESMPVLFNHIPVGFLFGGAFFLLVAFAALTSAISITEVPIAYLMDHFGWKRKNACIFVGVGLFVLGIPCINENAFSLAEAITDWILPLASFFIALFVGWRMPADIRKSEFLQGNKLKWAYPIWLWLIRIFIPVCLFIIAANKMGFIKTETINRMFGF